MLEADSERWIVGRAGSADLVVSDPDVSRRHFEIVRERSGTYRIHDLGSKNGLFVNGAPVEDGPLRAGDEVRAGGTVLRFDA
jgi:pSer/pThr/pTyr-binding forkhead associated (FHA) protein